MPKNNIFLTLLFLVSLSACSSLEKALYREGELKSDFDYPENKKIARSFYLLGDGGYSKPGGTSEGLVALDIYLDSVKQKGNYTLFLGDNIYPDGMEEEGHPLRERGEYRIDAQLEAVEDYDGQVIFLPGNHDWYNEGLNGLQRQRDYIASQLDDETVFAPEPGCPFKSIDVSEKVQLIVVDSQWYLADWDKHPLINRNCTIKTREALFLALENELEIHQDKVVVFAIHHPLYTNGVHGGAYNFNTHIYPSQNKMPVPILGSIVMLARTSGGVSSTDIQNLQYKTLINRLEALVRDKDNVVFVSGHEHSLQYIEKDGIKQIVSGSGSKATYVNLGKDGLFAYEGQGFVVLDVFEDGSTWASFYGSENYQPKLLYQKEIFKAPEELQAGSFSEDLPDTIKASVYEPSEENNQAEFKNMWSKNYRRLYETPIDAKIVNLDTLLGGLEVVRTGNEGDGKILKLEDNLGRRYNMRPLKKKQVDFIGMGTTDRWTGSQFRSSVDKDILDNFYTASHPYAFLVVPELSKAVGLAYTNPEIYYIPQQRALQPYNEEFGDELYIIEERPEGEWKDYEPFGAPENELESTLGVFERLRRDEDYEVDESAYIRARVFDMLVGDWDSDQSKWRWAPFEDEEGKQNFRPIPRDRDQAFSNFDGAFMSTLRGMTGLVNQFSIYEEDIRELRWFNSAALGLDRTLLQNSGREEWIKQAEYVQQNVTDEVIENAFAEIPAAVQGKSTEEIKNILKERRKNIVDIIDRYYKILAEYSIVTGTDKNDFAEVERLSDGRTRVAINRIKDGQKADVISTKVYDPEFTKEIWLYGLNDADIFEVSGREKANILVRIIGGHGEDIYRVQRGEKVKIYDFKSLPNVIDLNKGADLELTDNYDINVFDKDRKIYSTTTIVPAIGYNPDDEFTLGFDVDFTRYRFRRNPFTSQHGISGIYYSATDGFELHYNGEFANSWGDYNLSVGANFTSPDFTRNFFGYGNETVYEEDEVDMDYHRARVSKLGVEAGLVKESTFGTFLKFMASLEGIKVEPTENRFITEAFSANNTFFERKYFYGIEGIFRYASYDDVLNPTNGMRFNLNVGGKSQVEKADQLFGFLETYLGFYRALTTNRKLVLNPRVEARVNFGDDFLFYQAAALGGDSGLRGYRTNRFSGESALATGTDLRLSFDQFDTGFIPLQLGVFAGYDLGRVWLDGENSNVWHDSYGGGIFLVGAHYLTGKFNMFKGSEGWRFSFTMGLNF